MPQLKQHATIIVESDRRALKSKSPCDFIYQLTQTIKFTKRSRDKQYFIRLENIRIPISFYNINENNNTFEWDTDPTGSGITALEEYSFDIPSGNYSIDDLIEEVEDQMNSNDSNNVYNVTYNEPTQIVNISSTGVHDLVALDGDGWRMLGFDKTETITGVSDMEGNNVAYTNTMRHLKLQIPNLVSNNVYSNDENLQTQVQPVGVIVPITEIRNDYQFYNNHQGPLIKLSNQSSISDICVKLLDADNNVVNLNGVPFGFEVVIYEYNK